MKTLGQIAYEAGLECVLKNEGNIGFWCKWDELESISQRAWEEAARTVVEEKCKDCSDREKW